VRAKMSFKDRRYGPKRVTGAGTLRVALIHVSKGTSVPTIVV